MATGELIQIHNRYRRRERAALAAMERALKGGDIEGYADHSNRAAKWSTMAAKYDRMARQRGAR